MLFRLAESADAILVMLGLNGTLLAIIFKKRQWMFYSGKFSFMIQNFFQGIWLDSYLMKQLQILPERQTLHIVH